MISYLLAFPDSGKKSPEPPEQIKGLKDAPYFQPVDINVLPLGYQTMHVENIPVTVIRQSFDERVQIVECRFDLADTLSQNAIQHRLRVQKALLDLLLPEEHRSSGMFEEYVILCLLKMDGMPDSFIEENASNLARFIRAQREVFDPAEIEEALVSRVRYSADDLTVVDWEGAIIISPEGDFQSDIELLKIGNFQLLRYRMLDQSIEESLRILRTEFQSGKRAGVGPTRNSLRRIVNLRLELMLDFEHTDQNLLLIGDWYTAKLYHVIRDEFYLDNWKEVIKNKLDNLETIVNTIKENFSLSWSALMESVELAGSFY
jgi:hypothetical protein